MFITLVNGAKIVESSGWKKHLKEISDEEGVKIFKN